MTVGVRVLRGETVRRRGQDLRSRLSVAVVAFGSLLLTATVAAGPADSRLSDAVRRGNASEVAALIAQRVDVNGALADGVTPLFWAVHAGHAAVTEMLIRAGARVNAADDTGVTPLYLACTNQAATMVQTLLAAKADPNAALLNGETPLMNCARTGNAAAVKALIAAGASVDATERSHDQTALMWAAAEGHPAAVQVLLDAGASVGARSRAYLQTVAGEGPQRPTRSYNVMRGGSTPLLFAARNGDVDSARLLLAAGASPNDALPDGMSALTLAAFSGQAGVALLLLDRGADPNDAAIGYTALHAAVLRADSSRALTPGIGALVDAASRGPATELDLVKALLAHGANPNARMTRGTPVRRQNADFNLPVTRVGTTPYLLAAELLESETMRALAAGGADTTLTTPNGSTALMLAAGITAGDHRNRRGVDAGDGGVIEDQRRVAAAVRAALEAAPDVNRANDAGDTALHAASGMGYDDVVQLLADKGARVNVTDKRGKTPLMLAVERGQRRNIATSYDPGDRQNTATLLRRLGATQ